MKNRDSRGGWGRNRSQASTPSAPPSPETSSLPSSKEIGSYLSDTPPLPPAQTSSGYTAKANLPYVILKPTTKSRPIDTNILRDHVLHTLGDGLPRLQEFLHRHRGDVIAIDVETRGNSVRDPNHDIVGLGLAARDYRGRLSYMYLVWDADDTRMCSTYMSELLSHPFKFIAHNQLYECTTLRREQMRLGMASLGHGVEGHLTYLACTYGLVRSLANEGWTGQLYGLKHLQEVLLGWGETNEKERDEWLVHNGWVTRGPKRRKPTKKMPEGESQEEWLGRLWEAYNKRNKKGSRLAAPNPAEMWRCPPEILGPYCILDCISTLDLYEYVLNPALDKFDELRWFHENVFIANNRILSEQILDGLRVNVDGFRAYEAKLLEQIKEKDAELRTFIPGAEEWINEYEARNLAKYLSTEQPPKHKPFSRKEPKNRYNKNGSESKAWIKWDALRKEHELNPPVYKAWIDWHEKRERLHTDPAWIKKWKFSWDSSLCLTEFIYFSPASPLQWRESGNDGKNGHPTVIMKVTFGEGDEAQTFDIEMERTETGALPTGKKAVKQWGTLGKKLLSYREDVKELGYVRSWIKLSYNTDHPGIAEWHRYPGTTRVSPGWISPGTYTGRLAGTSPNLHQSPKSIAFLSNIIADEGESWGEKDWNSVEPVVLCELSQDPALLHVYGPGAKPNCIYLYDGADFPYFGPIIRATGYDPLNPTKESVAKAKAEAAKARSGAKTAVLGFQYGMGWNKLQQELRLNGVFLDDETCKALVAARRKKYHRSSVVFAAQLESEWKMNGGYFLDGLGHPVCVAADKTKDMISRCIQRTAHSIHMLYLYIIEQAMLARGLHNRRWRVADWHDQLIVAFPSEDANTFLTLDAECTKELNEVWLKSQIPVKGEPKVVRDMATAKEAEE